MIRIFLLFLIAALLPVNGAMKGALIDINTASPEQLKTLPGIRDAKAAAIIKNRPYANKAQLLSRKILSPAEYRQIRGL
jgi:DNA uptake protein ComE-like DNA-binding protein